MDGQMKQRLNFLLNGWYNQTIGPEEEAELIQLLETAASFPVYDEVVKEFWAETAARPFFSNDQKEKIVKLALGRSATRRMPLWRIAAAIAFLMIGTLALWFLIDKKGLQNPQDIVQQGEPAVEPEDIQAPSGNKAILTLSDGRKLLLDSMGAGLLATEETVRVSRQGEGELVYSGGEGETLYHTLSVPRGSKPFRLTLPDGSVVTVNVESTLRYPTSFAGTQREISLVGEAYFDVQKTDQQQVPQPFIVNVKGSKVEVLGTRFNINAYENESGIKTTLLSGAVRLASAGAVQELKPGQQALIPYASVGTISVIRSPDIDEAMAWLNGKFRFTEANVETVMRQVARWYDVEVVYAARPSLRFGGHIDRNSSLRQMLTILETSGLNFEINGREVKIIP